MAKTNVFSLHTKKVDCRSLVSFRTCTFLVLTRRTTRASLWCRIVVEKTLRQFIDDRDHLDDLIFFNMLYSGFKTLESMKIDDQLTHRDIRPDNVQVSKDGHVSSTARCLFSTSDQLRIFVLHVTLLVDVQSLCRANWQTRPRLDTIHVRRSSSSKKDSVHFGFPGARRFS